MSVVKPKLKVRPRESRPREALAEEMKRIQSVIKELSDKLVDPELALSSTMRLSIRQNELLAYVRGIRFALGEEEFPFDVDDPEA
jgi:hypothetical protein